MGVSYRSKSASVSYEPGITSVRRLIHCVRGTVKYGATLETPVVTRLDTDEGTWTAFSEPPSCAPGASGNLVLRFAPMNGVEACAFRAEWSADADLRVRPGAPLRDPGTGEWIATYRVPEDTTKDEFLVRVRITRPAVGHATTSLTVVVPVAAPR